MSVTITFLTYNSYTSSSTAIFIAVYLFMHLSVTMVTIVTMSVTDVQ